MKIPDKYIKIITMAVLFAVVLPSFSLLSLTPKKAQAIVPVFDGANFGINLEIAVNTWMTSTAVSGLAFKDVGYIPGMNPAGASAAANAASCRTFDCIAYLLAKQLIRALLLSVISWVQTGFEGQPVFISDFERFAKDAAMNASGVFLENYLEPDVYEMLCQPWRLPVFNRLKDVRREILDYSKTQSYPKCTLDTIISNAEGFNAFLDDFRVGGWDAWFSIMDKPTNSPTGLSLATESLMATAMTSAEERADTETVAGQGFISLADCARPSPSGNFCEVFQIKSPGKWIENQVGEWTTTDLASLEVADEMDELISAFINVLLNSLFTSLLDWRR